MTSVAAACLMVAFANDAMPSGGLTVHPMSDRTVVKKAGSMRHQPDRRVELSLVSYTVPTRSAPDPGALERLACRFTVSVVGGTTTAALDERRSGAGCGMGALTSSVVAALETWRFEVTREPKSMRGDRYWLEVRVHFVEGSTVSEVDVAQSVLAGKMPSPPFSGLRIVEPPRLRDGQSVPPALAGLDENCALHLVIDEFGVPLDVEVGECPESVQNAVRAAAWKWQFEPQLVNGTTEEAEFTFMLIASRR